MLDRFLLDLRQPHVRFTVILQGGDLMVQRFHSAAPAVEFPPRIRGGSLGACHSDSRPFELQRARLPRLALLAQRQGLR